LEFTRTAADDQRVTDAIGKLKHRIGRIMLAQVFGVDEATAEAHYEHMRSMSDAERAADDRRTVQQLADGGNTDTAQLLNEMDDD
jgi:hypothetical protein